MNLKDKIKIYRQTIQTLDESTDDYLYVLDLQNRRVFLRIKFVENMIFRCLEKKESV